MKRLSFIVILLILLFVVNLYTVKEQFNICDRYDKCSKYDGKEYSKCYNTNECSVMIDLIGNAFCTSENV